MFEPGEQPTSTGEPGQEEGTVLQKYLSQLGIPAGTGQPQVSGLPSNDTPVRLRLPRYYGAPPQHASGVTTSEAYGGNLAENTSSNPFERIKPLLAMAVDCKQPDLGPYPLDPSQDTGNLVTRLGRAQKEVSGYPHPQDHPPYGTSGINRLFPYHNEGASFVSKESRQPFSPGAKYSDAVVPAPVTNAPAPEKAATNSSSVVMTGPPNSEQDSQSQHRINAESEQRRKQAAGVSGNPANVNAGKDRGVTKATAASPAGPDTVWMIGKDGVPRRVPVGQYASSIKNNYKLAIPVVGPYGDSRYVSFDQVKDFISQGYQPGRRVQLDGKHGSKEIIVPLEDAEQKVPKGAKLLPMTDQEANITSKAAWYGAVQSAGIPGLGLKPPPWQPGDTERAELMVSGASKASVESYLPQLINGLKWKFGENSWHDYLPAALRIITAESSDFVPRTQAGASPNDMRFGHGWVQLSNMSNFERINKELGLKGTKDDIVKNPGLANRPDIAAKILAQYIYDRQREFEPLLARPRDPKAAPDPRDALALYIKWLQEDYLPWKQDSKRYMNSLNQSKEQDPRANTQALLNNDLVKERLLVNTSHFQHTPFEGLPNGLERFLAAAAFERKHQNIIKAAQDPKSNSTLKDAANEWIKGVEAFGDRNYAATLRKRLGFPEGADLSKIKISQLPPEMLGEMIQAQRDYAQQVVHSLERLAHPKNPAVHGRSSKR